MKDYSCFKAYDIRGRVPDELDEELCHDLGLSFAAEFCARHVVVGRDARLEGPPLLAALIDGLCEGGADVADLGLCGTEEVSHAAATQGFDGGLMLTASHNPKGYNGLKLVRGGAIPVSGDSGLFALRDRMARRDFFTAGAVRARGKTYAASFRAQYAEDLLREVAGANIAPFKIVANPGNGTAGAALEALRGALPCEFVVINGEPDGTFPHGIPNPLLPELREATAKAVREHKADLGLAWDGDFDRCFFYDADGEFIEGYYLVGLLAAEILRRNPGAKIIHDPRLIWNTVEMARQAGGIPIESKTGHAFIKERMRLEDAVYGGEMSAHHYFKNFAYCDSGMLPWLELLSFLTRNKKSLREVLHERIKAYPCSGEINRQVADAPAAVRAVRTHFAGLNPVESGIDGLSLDFGQWRCNLRSSNTEPLLRLNVEARGDVALMRERTEEILAILNAFAE